MNRQPTAVNVVGTLAQSVEQNGINQADKKSKGAVGVGHDQKQRRPLVAELI